MVMMHVRFPLSLRNVQDLLHDRGIDICHETVRHWVDRFGIFFAQKIRKRHSERMRQSPQWQWHMDGVFVNICRQAKNLWRAFDHECGVLVSFVTKTRDKASGFKFTRKVMKRTRRRANTSTAGPKARTCRFDEESGRYPISGDYEVSRSSPRFIPQCTTNSSSTGISIPAQT